MGTIKNPLDFERPLVELEAQLEAMRDAVLAGDETRRNDYAALETKVAKLRHDIYSKLGPYERVQLSRHFDRPFTLDYIKYIIEDFTELHGDRLYGEDAAIVGGIGRLGGQPIVIVGHQRGRTTQERLKRNFGMPQPEGYRKALRLFRMAAKFNKPILTFIDTQGAYPGLEAEERGQAEAIARNLLELALLPVPIIAIVIGEGGSGGALALGVADRILMMANACYSVITPEGCASILWHDAKKASVAAEAQRLTADDLKKFAIIDEIIPEPQGGAHTNHKEAAELLRAVVVRHFDELKAMDAAALLEARYAKFRAMGVFTAAD